MGKDYQNPQPRNGEAELPWYIGWVRREKTTIRGAPVSFISCVAICTVLLGIGLYWFEEKLYRAEIETLKTRVEILNGTSPVLPGSASQVKAEAFILVRQMFEFSKTFNDGTEPYFQHDYQRRFALRVDKMRNSLDQLGQVSTNLDLFLGYRMAQGTVVLPTGIDSNIVYQVANEIQTLANNLK
jgi:hypothetical protein